MPTTSRVAVLHVGGTIAMYPASDGLAPKDGVVAQYLDQLTTLMGKDLPIAELHMLPPLKDSADMTPSDWVRIANAIVEHGDEVDGFVVIHGTDTMAYSASAVSFLLTGLNKPVVFTGAQLPLGDPRSDGREHLITSLLIAGTLDIPEVCIYFGDRLLRGNRSQKVDSAAFIAFDSGNLPPLARAGVEVDLQHDLIRAPQSGKLQVRTLQQHPEVISLRVYPGITPRLLAQVMAAPVQGVVLETYGAGTFPSANEALVAVVAEAIERGVVVVNTSSVRSGRVRPGLYGTGAALARVGVVSGQDMTPEAALTKLYCLLAEGRSPEETRRVMGLDMAGELTSNPEN